MKEYDACAIEAKWQRYWEKNGTYRFDSKSRKPIYSIDTPPPTLSGLIHMGHAMSYSQAEFIARYKRMRGYNVFYPMGFDDNGLPTERWVEQKYGLDIRKVGREKFIKYCLKETKIGGQEYRHVWTRLGISCDWNLLYSTINEHCQRISQRSFIDLFRKKRLERRMEPVTWCPECQTALAQADLEDAEEDSQLATILFEAEGIPLPIATSRPELLPACVGVVVHPEDTRYTHLVGRKARVPLFGREVTIIADKAVDIHFGTGIVMVCTFGDKVDIEWWKEYNLPTLIIINKDGTLNEHAGAFTGQKLREARASILAELKAKGLIMKQEPLRHVLNVHERCHQPVEFLVTEQWFVRILDIKRELLKKGREVRWYPDYMRKRYESWVANLKWDWCISRERYFGVPFPIWYCKKCGRIAVASEKDLPVDPLVDTPKKRCRCGSREFEPETDVLDTWFTSSCTPLIVAKWRDGDSLMRRIYPMGLRPQGYEIIRTWLFYTVLKSLLHTKTVPWKDCMISGMGLDPKGEAMHKSRGNVVMPLEVADKYSSDAVRWWASSVKLGDDLPYSEKDVVFGQKLCIKLWNAARLIKPHLTGKPRSQALSETDKWMLYRLSCLIKDSTKYLDKYEYSRAKILIETSFWHDFCDDYLEIVKHRLYSGRDEGALFTLYTCLLAYIKMCAIYMPHITEELYSQIFKKFEKGESIHLSVWPEPPRGSRSELGREAFSIIASIRKWKSEKGIPLNGILPHVIIFTKKNLSPVSSEIRGACHIGTLEVRKELGFTEKIISVSPNFSLIGPLFGKDTGRVAGLVKKHAGEILSKGGIEREGITLKPEFIGRMEREFYFEQKRMEMVETEKSLVGIVR
jgi:valyl-tRNA synthetase